MEEGFLYLDSSALVKLVLPEPETDALLQLLADWGERVSSSLAAVEVQRARGAHPTTNWYTEEPNVWSRAYTS